MNWNETEEKTIAEDWHCELWVPQHHFTGEITGHWSPSATHMVPQFQRHKLVHV